MPFGGTVMGHELTQQQDKKSILMHCGVSYNHFNLAGFQPGLWDFKFMTVSLSFENFINEIQKLDNTG